jgi:UDP-N-acetylglucosamine acyltransferase
MAGIHPSAVVDRKASLGVDVDVGPFCVVGPEASLGDRVRLVSHVSVDGRTSIGADTVVYPFSSLGHPPQSLKYKGEASTLSIGAGNTIREHVTMNPGTRDGGMVTSVGDNGLFMVGVHIAHDCRVGNNVIMANNATLGGHVVVGDFAYLGGLCAIHQFVRIGPHAMIGGLSAVADDVIPYGLIMGDRASLHGLNVIGLKRRGFSRDDIHTLRTAYRLLFAQEGTMAERIEDVAALYRDNRPVMDMLEFIMVDSSRRICQPKLGNAG